MSESMAGRIDQAIAEVLGDLGDGWWVSEVRVDDVDATTTGEAYQGLSTRLPGRATVTLKHQNGLTSIATAPTVGGAIARAALNLVVQSGRMLDAQRV